MAKFHITVNIDAKIRWMFPPANQAIDTRRETINSLLALETSKMSVSIEDLLSRMIEEAEKS